MENIKPRVVVIGAVNMDICGMPSKELVMRDSNPGRVSFSVGGVGRNIALNLCRMGLDVSFIAAIGNDMYGDDIFRRCAEAGIDMHMCRRVDGRTSTYMYITDKTGDMALAVSDTDIAESINPEYLSRWLSEINSARALVFDGNLTAETAAWLAENVSVPMYADPVSAAKADRIKPALSRLYGFKPNAMEAMHMTGKSTPLESANALASLGVKRVFVSCGAGGIIALEKGRTVTLPCIKVNLVNATGAGDAATAAIVWAGVNGLSLEDSARAALRAGAATTQCAESVF